MTHRIADSGYGERRSLWQRAIPCGALAVALAGVIRPVSAGPPARQAPNLVVRQAPNLVVQQAPNPLSQQAPNPQAVVVGRLFGDDVSVQGASFESNFGVNTALLVSGSDVTVRSGRAQIELMRGGAVAICGPAHFTLLESGGAITLALDYGRVRPQVDAQVNLTVFTPMIVATPVAIGTNPRDLTVGLDREGAMCTVTAQGAARIAQQLSGESVLVPQGGEISLNGGQLGTLRSANGSCDCELLVTRNQTPAPKSVELSIPVPNPATRPRPAAAPALPPPPPVEQPIYRVYLPPLTFDANAPEEAPDPDPAHILLVREAMPLAEFNLGAPAEPSTTSASDYVPPSRPAVTPVKATAAATQPKKGNIFARFFGAMFGRRGTRCRGTGCGDAGD